MPDDQKTPPRIPVNPHTEASFPPSTRPAQPESAQQDYPESASVDESPKSAKSKSIKPKTYKEITDPGERWNALVHALLLNRRNLLSIPGVTAVDIGYKLKDGEFKDELALRVHVERKLPDSTKDTTFKDRPYDFIPKEGDNRKPYFPWKGYEDVPTDVIEGNYRPMQPAEPSRPGMVLEKPKDPENVDRRRRLDPLVGGISIGSPHAPSGTLGALVWDNTDGSVCILSNWHVLSGDLRTETGTACFQPGRLDQGRSSDEVARLKRWSFDRQTDAAIAELTGSRRYCAGEILSLFQQITGSTPPHLGMLVQKYGRSTGFTWGFVDGLYFSAAIKYSNGIVQVFEDQIHIAPVPPEDPTEPVSRISEPGDSGAVWLTKTEKEGYQAVGLHFAGDLPHSSFGEYALANPMSVVEKRLNFSFRPRFLEIRDEDVIMAPHPSPFELHVNGNGKGKGNGNGAHPNGVILGGTLRGSGGHGDPIEVQPTGGTRP